MQSKMSPHEASLKGKLVHLALPVRWNLIGQEGRASQETACTYDIHPGGARLVCSRDVNVGELVMVERGRHKAMCQVVWSAYPASPLREQYTLQRDDGRAPCDRQARQME